jgi:DNA-binding XRE family transcriptional regulator
MTPRDLSLIAEARAALASGSARSRRLAAGVRVAEIASAAGVTPQAVSAWESGRRAPRGHLALAYWRALAAAEKGAA